MRPLRCCGSFLCQKGGPRCISRDVTVMDQIFSLGVVLFIVVYNQDRFLGHRS